MINYSNILANNRETLVSKLNNKSQEDTRDILESALTLLDLYKEDMEELINACGEERLPTLYIPRGVRISQDTDSVSDILLELIYLGTHQKDIIKEEVTYVEPNLNESADIDIASLILGDLEFEDTTPQEPQEPQIQSQDSPIQQPQQPVVLQEPTTKNTFNDYAQTYGEGVQAGIVTESKTPDTPIQEEEKEPEKELQNQQEIQPSNTKVESSTEQVEYTLLDISKLKEGEKIQLYAYCSMASTNSSTKSSWLDLTLRDINGASINAKLFGYTGDTPKINGKVVLVIGTVSTFKGTMNIKLDTVTDEDIPVKESDFIKSIPQLSIYIKILQELIGNIKDTSLRAMALNIFKEENILAHYCNRASSVKIHGVLKGDLLKHCVNVARTALFQAKINELPVNTDVVTVSALLHDVGKIIELPPVGQTEYTVQGMLFGHTFIGANYVYEKCKEFKIDTNVTYNIVHCILSHHGKEEYGAIKIPATIEAQIVSNADLAESHAIHAAELLANAKPEERRKSMNGTFIKI